MKNYVIFLNDHSGSMSGLETGAIADYNANVTAIKDAATAHMLDTIVSMSSFGGDVRREIVNSNPHVLKPLTRWQTGGGTPMYAAILDAITLFRSLPDYSSPDVSFVVMATTDGAATDSHRATEAANAIRELTRDERWTFVFRVPTGARSYLSALPISAGNIQEWDTTTAGLAASTAKTTEAVTQFYAARASGARGSNTFYANAANVDAKAVAATLKDISGDVSLYVVPDHQNGIEIRPFILSKRMNYLKGSAFYQLTKTEARVSETKLIAIRDRSTGKIYSGVEARKLIGMPTSGNARLHPGDHGNFDIFVQSESINRKLVGGTGVLYWDAIGVPFKPEDTAYLNGPVATNANGVVELPKVAPTNKPTPSPLKPTPKVAVAPAPAPIIAAMAAKQGGRVRFHQPANDVVGFYSTRDIARGVAEARGLKQYDAGPSAPSGKRWYVAK